MDRVPEKLRQWLTRAVEAGASDLHLIAGYPPVLRLHGDFTELPEPVLAAEQNVRDIDWPRLLMTLTRSASEGVNASPRWRFGLAENVPFSDAGNIFRCSTADSIMPGRRNSR